MTAGLAVGITAAVVIACAAGAWLYSTHHFRTLIESERSMALAQGEIMRAALEHQMMENDRSLIADMVRSFGDEPRVTSVMLLDREGTVRYSSRPVADPRELEMRSETCQACHRLPPEQRDSSRVVETGGGSVLRTVVPFRNRQACHQCHDPGHTVNGIMIYDLDAGQIHAAVNRDLRWLVGGTGGLGARPDRPHRDRGAHRSSCEGSSASRRPPGRSPGATSTVASRPRGRTPSPGWPGSSTPWPTR